MMLDTYQCHKSWVLLLLLVLAIAIIYKAPSIATGEFPAIRSKTSAHSDPMTLTARLSHNLVYWKPHKTGSTSMLLWLKEVSNMAKLNLNKLGYYPYSDSTTWHEFAGPKNCTLLIGHIRVHEERKHEGSLGAVITTSRNPMDTFASKYFHRTRQGANDIPFLSDKLSKQSRYWFFYFNDLDPCEQLRYYDGMEGCDMETLRERVRTIAERIDCVVDTDDADEDVAGICRMMNLPECPTYPLFRVANSGSYAELFQNAHLVEAMQRVIRVGDILREELMKRRCRFLEKGDELTKPGVPKPQWPQEGCMEVKL